MKIIIKGEIMFGYIKIFKPGLKTEDFDVYKGVYCSLCKQLGKDYGLTARFFLNYDFTFLSLCLLSLSDNDCNFIKSNCSFCFRKKCLHCDTNGDSLKYSAAITIITTYHKVLDNIDDKKFLKKVPYYIISKIIKNKYKKAKRIYPDITEKIEIQMKKQSQIEFKKINSIDQAAHSTATSLANIFTLATDGANENLYRFGYCLGRYIYICDAIDDLEKDHKNKNYNPFLTNHSGTPDFSLIRSKILPIINTTADELAKSYEKIQFRKYKVILNNIIYYGIDNTINNLLKKEENADEKSI